MSPLYFLLYFAISISIVLLVFMVGASIIVVGNMVIDRIFRSPEVKNEDSASSTSKIAQIRSNIEKKRAELSELHAELEDEESKKDPYNRTV